MEIQTWVIAANPPQCTIKKFPVKITKPMYNVILQVAVNTVRIQKGAQLRVSHMRDDLDIGLGVHDYDDEEDGKDKNGEDQNEETETEMDE